MKHEYTQTIDLKSEDLTRVDLHSLLNIMNILISLFYQAGKAIGDEDHLETLLDEVYDIVDIMKDSSKVKGYVEGFNRFKAVTMETLAQVEADYPERYNARVAEEIEAVINILEIRSVEWLKRVEHPQQWDEFDINSLKQNFCDVFRAVEKYSNGRYRIVNDPKEQGMDDYLIELNFMPESNLKIRIPSVFQDTMRDTVLNARKYTQLGGRISASLSFDPKYLLWEVKDNGIGIPPEDLPHVIEFGYRAGNVTDRQTMGAGFGLTKAYLVTRQFNGRMWIDSELDQGTTLTIQIPLPAE